MDIPRNAVLRLVGLVLVVVTIGVAGWSTMRGGSAEGSASENESAVVTAPVERRVLESLQVTRGTVLAPSQATIQAGAPDEGELATVVTGLPLARGTEVAAGGLVVEINGRPVFALPGTIPVYRDIRPGDVGPDVVAVQDALSSLGHEIAAPERAGESFGSSTQRAVQALYESSGYEPAYTLGSRDAVIEAEQAADDMVAAAQTALDSAMPPPEEPASSDAFDAAQDALDDAVAARSRVQAAEGVTLPAREFVAVPSLPASIVELPVRVGERLDPGMTVAAIGANEFRVRIELTPAQVNELADDMVIAVFSDRGYEASCPAAAPRPEGAADEEGGSDDATGSPSAPGAADASDTAADDAAGDGGSGDGGSGDGAPGVGTDGGEPSSDGYVMDVVCDPLPPADSLGTSLRVTMTVRRSDGEVLVVPATAVTTTSSGGVFVEVIGPDDESRRVEVTMGGEADGFVEVAPVDTAALEAGMDVRVRRS